MLKYNARESQNGEREREQLDFEHALTGTLNPKRTMRERAQASTQWSHDNSGQNEAIKKEQSDSSGRRKNRAAKELAQYQPEMKRQTEVSEGEWGGSDLLRSSFPLVVALRKACAVGNTPSSDHWSVRSRNKEVIY